MNQTDNMKEKTCETPFEKIIDIAFDLFLENGYEDTTIRMIVEKAGIHIGSLYYLFPNKESILKAMMITVYDMIHKKAEIVRINNNDLAALLYPTASILYMTSRSKNVARLLYKSYSTWSVFDELLKFSKNWALKYDFSPNSDDREYHSKLFFVFGGLGNMIGEFYYSSRALYYRERLDKFIDVACRIFARDVPEDIESAKNLLYNLLESEEITILGKQIDLNN